MQHSVEQVELKNGAKGLLIDVLNATVMSFDFNFRAGDYLAPQGKWDTAHIMEHMVLGANKRYKSSIEFSKVFEQNGAYSNASTGSYHMSYVAECADFEAERILDLLCLSIEAPAFLRSEFKAEKANVREELKSRRNNHGHELSLAVSSRMGLSDLPYTERAKQLDAITLEDVVTHYKKTHTTSNLRFVIAGDIQKNRASIVERLEAIELTKGKGRIELPDEPLKTVVEPLVNQKSDVENLYYRYEVGLGILMKMEQIDAIGALGLLLFGSMHSRVFGKAREQGLVYGINYGDYGSRDTSLFYIGGQVLPENIEKLFVLISKELHAVADGGLTQEELDAIKLSSLGSFKRGTQTVGQLVDSYSPWFVFYDKVEDYYEVPNRINTLTVESIVKEAQRIIAHDTYSIGFAGDTKGIDARKLAKILTD
jgi:predicted Zn-dependent peptidase